MLKCDVAFDAGHGAVRECQKKARRLRKQPIGQGGTSKARR